MSLNVRWGSRPLWIGNSITVQGYFLAAGGLLDQMNAAAKLVPRVGGSAHGATFTGPKGVVVGNAGIVSAAPECAPVINQVNQGGNSFTIELINANYSTFVTQFLPLDLVILECVVNNQFTDPAMHFTDYSAFLDRLRSDGAKQVLCLGAFLFQFTGEQWTAGTPNTFNSGLTATHPIEANVAAACAARPGWTEYCPLWDTVLAYEVAHNTPAPGVVSGILSLDGVHPNSTGQVLMGTTAMSHLTFSV